MTRYSIVIPALLIAAGCAGCGTAATTPEPTKASAPVAATAGKAAAPAKAPQTVPPKAAAAAPKTVAAAPKPAVAAPKSVVAAPKTVAAAPKTVAAVPTAPPLDLKSLEQRLKETSAIGVLTKLSLKNQVDDLIARFKAFHDGSRPPTLAELRPAFELLIMKVLSLLQDQDRALASAINASRDAIWGVLSDRQKLSAFL